MKRLLGTALVLCMLSGLAVTASAEVIDESVGATTESSASTADSDWDSGDSGSAESDADSEAPTELTVKVNGKTVTRDALEIVSQVVQNEVGTGFHEEAIKAQAVAAYTFIAQSNAAGGTPTVYLTEEVSPKVEQAVAEVMGEAIYYKHRLAFTPYHATSASMTTSSSSVWGGKYPYLVAVDSPVDKKVKGFKTKTAYTSEKVAELIEDKLGIAVSGDPAEWVEILSYTDGGYVDEIAICGETKSAKGTALTGRLLREAVLGLRSACFDVEYDSDEDKFIFTTYGYGHGVGMSQNGANAYANDGWNYVEILEHYYPGTEII